MNRLLIRFLVPVLAGIGALTLASASVLVIRGPVREMVWASACDWQILSEATCYWDTGHIGLYDDAINDIAAKEDLQRQLAPIIAEQERLKSSNREREKNARSIALEAEAAFILGCERDKLALMQEGKDVSKLDCRKGTKLGSE